MATAVGATTNIIKYIYRGEEDEVIPIGVTHVTIHKDVTSIRADAFAGHRNIIEVVCHDKVERIEQDAFHCCRSLERVIMRGVKVVEEGAFVCCKALTDVECDKLEIIQQNGFGCCESLRSLHLPSARIVEGAFDSSTDLMSVKFGNKLERIELHAFYGCESLERITIPLKDGLIIGDDIFQECENLKHVDLVEGELQEIIAALQLEEWRICMNEEIDSINRILPNARAGYYDHDNYDEDYGDGDPGEKAQEIRRWIRSVLRKIIHYQAEHQRLLDEEAAAILQLILPQDIASTYVLSFLELPSHTFEVEEDEEEDDQE